MNMQRFVVPEGTTGISFEGQNYEVEDGIVELPAHADPSDLKAHGLHVYSPSTPPAATPETGGTGPDQGGANTNAAPSTEGAATGAVTPPWASK